MPRLGRHSRKLGRQTSASLAPLLAPCGEAKEKEGNAPSGRVPVYVGKEGHGSRFMVDVKQLNHPLFRDLLEQSAAETGYSHQGAIRIACDVLLFQRVLKALAIANSNTASCSASHHVRLKDLMRQSSMCSSSH